VLAAASWLGLMFLLAVLLAICIPRAPDPRVTASALRGARDVWLERFYLLVLSVCLLVFYLTVPVVSLALLAISMFLFVILCCLRILHIGILQRGFFASWGVIRSVFLGPSRHVQGIAVDEKSQPRLIGVLREVADKLETSPVDFVSLAPNAQICVYEMGSGPFGLFRRRRFMEIGIPTFSQLTQTEFKSIIAHEYGHFTHRDPFYTQFISQVTGSLTYSMGVMQGAGGVLTYVNPFYWFYWLYLRAYTLLAAGFSRSREFLADRRAVVAFGKEAFVSGLTKISVDGGLFTNTTVGNIRRELSHFLVFVNVFEAFRDFRDRPESAETRRKLLEDARTIRPSWSDTHPTYSERIAAVSLFPDSSAALDGRPASELLAGLQGIEERLTQMLTAQVRQTFYPQGGPIAYGRIETSPRQSDSPAPPAIANSSIDYENAEAVLAAASASDHRGEWADAIALYTYASRKWKEGHSAYAENCIRAIEQKRALADPSPASK
jgi:Zn-dependent protease with chaperone function